MQKTTNQDQPQPARKILSEGELLLRERALELEQLEEREYEGTYRNDQA